jgi:hypothetical protein
MAHPLLPSLWQVLEGAICAPAVPDPSTDLIGYAKYEAENATVRVACR